MSTTIPPTVGRVVWFYPSTNSAQAGFASPDEGRPLAAIIARVWNDRMVNLTVFDANGVPHSRTSVPLVQDGQDAPALGYYASWMPYQIGQAKKHETELAQDDEPKTGAAIQANANRDPAGAGFSFSAALVAIKGGQRVARAGWNGKGMFVYLVPANSYPAQTGAAKAFFGERGMVPYNAYFALKGADDTVSTWAPSGSDALAEDWLIVK